jgi:hypothetical protein
VSDDAEEQKKAKLKAKLDLVKAIAEVKQQAPERTPAERTLTDSDLAVVTVVVRVPSSHLLGNASPGARRPDFPRIDGDPRDMPSADRDQVPV